MMGIMSLQVPWELCVPASCSPDLLSPTQNPIFSIKNRARVQPGCAILLLVILVNHYMRGFASFGLNLFKWAQTNSI